MHYGAIGVAVYNNYVHDFGFAGIRCGDRISEVFSCAMTDVSQNLVVATGVNATGNMDAAGLYWNTHWHAPGEWGTRQVFGCATSHCKAHAPSCSHR